MEKKDFYIKDDDLKIKSLELMSGTWGKHSKITLTYFFIILFLGASIFLAFKFLDWYYALIITIVASFLFSNFNFGYNSYCLESVKNTNVSVKMLFSGFSKQSFKIFILLIAKILIVAIGLCLFVFPGVYFLIKYSMSGYVLKENNNLSAIKVLKRSSKLMKSNIKRFLAMFFRFLSWFLLGIITGGIAMLWILPYYQIEKAVFYEDLKTDF